MIEQSQREAENKYERYELRQLGCAWAFPWGGCPSNRLALWRANDVPLQFNYDSLPSMPSGPTTKQGLWADVLSCLMLFKARYRCTLVH